MGIQNFYNSNSYQNYGHNAPVANRYQQQSGFDLSSVFSMLFSQLLGQGSFQQPSRQQTNLNSLFGGYRQPSVNSSFPGVNINNAGYIGNININAGNQVQQNPWFNLLKNFLTDKKPVSVDETSVEVTPKSSEKPHKVAIIGGYDQGFDFANLGETIKNFAGTATANDIYTDRIGTVTRQHNGITMNDAHNIDKTNDKELAALYSKMSDEDKKRTLTGGAKAFVIDETTGKILGEIGAQQLGDKGKFVLQGYTGKEDNDKFKNN